MPSWRLEGQYVETCNCDFVCPCITSNLGARPTEGECKAAMVMRIDSGEKDGIALDGLAFVVLLRSPGPMAEGGLTVGLIVDDRATPQQADAIAAIAAGTAGGPMAALRPLIEHTAGVERRPIRFETEGMRRTATAGDLVECVCEGVPSAVREGEPIWIDNVMKPANPRIALARAVRSRFHAFGIDWDDSSGERNGHFAPFSWAA